MGWGRLERCNFRVAKSFEPTLGGDEGFSQVNIWSKGLVARETAVIVI